MSLEVALYTVCAFNPRMQRLHAHAPRSFAAKNQSDATIRLALKIFERVLDINELPELTCPVPGCELPRGM